MINEGDKQSQALIGVEAGELRSLRRKHRDKHQRAEVGKDAHCLVIYDIRLIDGVCRLVCQIGHGRLNGFDHGLAHGVADTASDRSL